MAPSRFRVLKKDHRGSCSWLVHPKKSCVYTATLTCYLRVGQELVGWLLLLIPVHCDNAVVRSSKCQEHKIPKMKQTQTCMPVSSVSEEVHFSPLEALCPSPPYSHTFDKQFLSPLDSLTSLSFSVSEHSTSGSSFLLFLQ